MENLQNIIGEDFEYILAFIKRNYEHFTSPEHEVKGELL